MDFGTAYFTSLAPDGPNGDFVQSYSTRLTYGLATRLNAVIAFPSTPTPYASDLPLPRLAVAEPLKASPTPSQVVELYLAVAAGIINQNARSVTSKGMRVRERMKIYSIIIENALRVKKETPYADVNAFVKGLKTYEATFPLHPALVVGPGFNIADSIYHPYFGAHHVTWSLQDNPFAFSVAELYESHVRQLVLSDAPAEAEFIELLENVLNYAQFEIEGDVKQVLRAWASDTEISFAPIVRLYVSTVESPAPFPNSLQVFNDRITAAFVTSLA